MTLPNYRAVPHGKPRTRNTREEAIRLKARVAGAKAITFAKIDEALWQHESFYGKYIIENTFDGPLRWRARRNGTLIKGGMVDSMDAAKAAVNDDIARRRKTNAPRPVGSLSQG